MSWLSSSAVACKRQRWSVKQGSFSEEFTFVYDFNDSPIEVSEFDRSTLDDIERERGFTASEENVTLLQMRGL